MLKFKIKLFILDIKLIIKKVTDFITVDADKLITGSYTLKIKSGKSFDRLYFN